MIVCCIDVETGVTHQLRSWFELAVNSDSAKHCALIWRLYMFFEVSFVTFVVEVTIVLVVALCVALSPNSITLTCTETSLQRTSWTQIMKVVDTNGDKS